MLRPEDAEARVDLAVALSHVGERDEAIKANREAIRLASLGSRSADRRRRIRVAAYFNLGKLKSARQLSFAEDNDGPSTCTRLDSDADCAKPVFVCGRAGADGTAMGRTDFRMARFALTRGGARIADGRELLSPLEQGSSPDFGNDYEQTHDRADAPSYDVSLSFEYRGRKAEPEEGSIEVSWHVVECAIVHVNACGRRLGLYCEWSDWREGAEEKRAAKAVELTFTAQ